MLGAAASAPDRRLEEAAARASLVIPNAWVRNVVVDVGELPRARARLRKAVRWRLKKLLPCRPEEVRLDYTPIGENGRVWVVLALDRHSRWWRRSSRRPAVRLGRIEPTVVALSSLLSSRGKVPTARFGRRPHPGDVVCAWRSHAAGPPEADPRHGGAGRSGRTEGTVRDGGERPRPGRGELQAMVATSVETMKEALQEWAMRNGKRGGACSRAGRRNAHHADGVSSAVSFVVASGDGLEGRADATPEPGGAAV